MNTEVEEELAGEFRIMALQLAWGIDPVKISHFFCASLRERAQRGEISAEELADMHARIQRWSADHKAGWTQGYAEGWAFAILRILEQRDVPMSDEIHGYIATRTDLKVLARWLDLAPTVTRAEELITTVSEDAPGG
ncbi:hypothetical protein ABZW47_20710 [Streptomyces sp. NPDC004549]|uniref:hypothetical protein n=1 Tax=unclassified Streptomyces TaxID=2593676 RepID=UPI0018F2BCA7|nr:hypothetical protein [Streptomyces sp. DSM 110735]MBJ7901931.1 hypothetical protein [Streptomyces sp. DSM 110735]